MVGSRTRAPTRTAEHHHARPAVAAVGLERQPPDEPEHLPSARPEPCDPSGLGSARCSRARPRPAPCRSPRARPVTMGEPPMPPARPAPSRACWSLRAIPSPSLSLRLRERCVSPTSATDSRTRAPCGLLDSRLRWPVTHRCVAVRIAAHGANAGSSWALGLAAARHGSLPTAYRMRRPGGASLDGEPPASALVAATT